MNIINQTPFAVDAIPNQIAKDRYILLTLVKGTFQMVADGRAGIATEQMPIAYGDELHDAEQGGSVKFEADLAPFKPRCDIALVGHVYAPRGTPVSSARASLQVGDVQKSVLAIGDRHWRNQGGHAVASSPQAFSTMALVYERAYGGNDPDTGASCAENPLGRGMLGEKTKKVRDGAPLPNIEDPDHLIQAWDDRPRPAGFGFWGKSWLPRAGFVGTYDEKWQQERAPGPPADFKSDFYNAAHPDLQVKGYLQGDENVTLSGVVKSGSIRFQLPGIQPKVDIESEDGTEALALKLDTLCLLPDEQCFYMVWRGFCQINNIVPQEIKTITVTHS